MILSVYWMFGKSINSDGLWWHMTNMIENSIKHFFKYLLFVKKYFYYELLEKFKIVYVLKLVQMEVSENPKKYL